MTIERPQAQHLGIFCFGLVERGFATIPVAGLHFLVGGAHQVSCRGTFTGSVVLARPASSTGNPVTGIARRRSRGFRRFSGFADLRLPSRDGWTIDLLGRLRPYQLNKGLALKPNVFTECLIALPVRFGQLFGKHHNRALDHYILSVVTVGLIERSEVSLNVDRIRQVGAVAVGQAGYG